VKKRLLCLLIAVSAILLVPSITAYGNSDFSAELPFPDGCPAEDVSGNNNDASCVGSPTTEVTGVSKSQGDWDYDDDGTATAYEFDGSNDYLDFGKNFGITGTVGISAWIHTDDLYKKQEIVAKGYDGSNTGYQLKIEDPTSGDSSSKIICGSYDGSNHKVQYSTSIISTNSWHHLVCTYNGTQWNLYVDGTLYRNENGDQSTGAVTSSEHVTVGEMLTSGSEQGQKFDGKIDEVKITSGYFNTTEVSNLFSDNKISVSSTSGSPAFSNFSPVDGASVEPPVSTKATITDGDDATIPDVWMKWSNGTVFKHFTSVSNETELSYQHQNLIQGQSYSWKITANDGTGNTTSSTKTFEVIAAVDSLKIPEISLPLNSTCPAEDYSGNNLDMTCNNGVSYSSSDSGYLFDGENDYLSTTYTTSSPASLDGDNFTIMAEARFSNLSVPAGDPNDKKSLRFIDVTNSGSSIQYMYLRVFNESSQELVTGFQSGSGNYFEPVTSVNLNESETYYISYSYDHGKVRQYIDGEQVNSVITTQNTMASDSFYIGVRKSADTAYMDGIVKEARMYDEYLNTSQIQTVTTDGISFDSISFNPSTGSIQQGDSVSAFVNTSGNVSYVEQKVTVDGETLLSETNMTEASNEEWELIDGFTADQYGTYNVEFTAYSSSGSDITTKSFTINYPKVNISGVGVASKFEKSRDNFDKPFVDGQMYQDQFSWMWSNASSVCQASSESGGYPKFYYWDSAMCGWSAAYQNRHMDQAVGNLNAMASMIDNYDYVPNIVDEGGLVQEDKSQPPWFTRYGYKLYQKTNRTDILSVTYKYGKKEIDDFWKDQDATDHWPNNRVQFNQTLNMYHYDCSGGGTQNRDVCVTGASGLDGSPRWNTPSEKTWQVYPIELNVYQYYNRKKLSEMCYDLRERGKSIPESECQAHLDNASLLKTAINDFMWNENDDYYYSWDDEENDQVKKIQLLGATPLIADGLMNDSREAKLAQTFHEQLGNSTYVTPPDIVPRWKNDFASFRDPDNKQFWDYPHSMPPIKQIVFDGLRKQHLVGYENYTDYLNEVQVGYEWTNALDGLGNSRSEQAWGYATYFLPSVKQKAGFDYSLAKNRLEFVPNGRIEDGMGGQFNIYNHNPVSATYHKSAKNVSISLSVDRQWRLNTLLYFNESYGLTDPNVTKDGVLLSNSEYELQSIDGDGDKEAVFINNSFSGTTYSVTTADSSDSTPPTSSDNYSASGFVDKSSTVVELTATDSAGGSGVANITYWLNGQRSDVSGSTVDVSITKQQNNSLVYRATDNAGNIEANNTEYVALDTPPNFQNFKDDVSGKIKAGGYHNLSIESKDGQGISKVILSTNETGTFKNYTGTLLHDFENGTQGFEGNTYLTTNNALYGSQSILFNESISSSISSYSYNTGYYSDMSYSLSVDSPGLDDVIAPVRFTNTRTDSTSAENYPLIDQANDDQSNSSYFDISYFANPFTILSETPTRSNSTFNFSYRASKDLRQIQVENLDYEDNLFSSDSSTNPPVTSLDSIELTGGPASTPFEVILDEIKYYKYGNPSRFLSTGGSYNLSTFQWHNKTFRGSLGYKMYVVDKNGNVNETSTNTITVNRLPNYDSSRVTWTGVGSGSETRQVFYNYSDPDISDVKSISTPPSGSITSSTNTSTVVDSWNSPFDWSASVTDFTPEIGANRSIDFSTSKKVKKENKTGIVNETKQTVYTQLNLTINGESINYTLDATNPANVLNTLQDGAKDSNTAATGVQKATWYWEVDNIAKSIFNEKQNTAKTSTEDTQYITKKKRVENTEGIDFSRLNVTAPSISGTLTNNTYKTIQVSGNTNKNLTYWASGDFLTEKGFNASPVNNQVELETNFTALRQYQLGNSINVDFSNVGITPFVNGNCTQTNSSTASVSASATENTSVGYNCDPGVFGSPDLDQFTNADSNNDTHYTYNTTDMEIKTNITQENAVFYWVDESELTDWDSRKSETGYLDGDTTNVSVSDGVGRVKIKFGTSSGNSSPSKGTHSASIFYEVGSENTTTIIEGGGGGGGTTEPSEEELVHFGQANTDSGLETVSVPFGETTVKNMTVTSQIQSPTPVRVTVNNGSACQYISVAKSLGSSEYGETGIYELPAASQTLGTVEISREFGIRYDVPNRSVLEASGTDLSSGFKCSFDTATEGATAEPLTVDIQVSFSFVDSVSRFLGPVGDWLFSDWFCFPTGEVKSTDPGTDACAKNYHGVLLAALVVGLVVGRRREWF